MTEEKIKPAEEAKKSLLFYFLYQRNFMCATTEMAIFDGFIADVFAASENRLAYEIEVKISWQDFMSEIKAIRGEIYAKTYKHKAYLENLGQSKFNGTVRPNKFYFSLPYRFHEKAIKELGDSPYGICDLNGYVHKIAKNLHEEKVSDNLIYRMIRKLSRANYELLKN